MSNNNPKDTPKAYIRTLIVTTCTITALLMPLSHPVTASQALMEHLLDNIEQYEDFWNTIDTRFAHAREVPNASGSVNVMTLTFEHTQDPDNLWSFGICCDGQSVRIDLLQAGSIQP